MRLYNGDCLEVLDLLIKEEVKVDFIFSDLPYGTTNCKWDTLIDLQIMWDKISKIKRSKSTPVALFAQTPFDKILGASNIKQLKYEWIWEKTKATGHLNAKKSPMKAHENILIFYEKPPVYNYIKTFGHKRKTSKAEHKKNCKESDIYSKNQKPTSYDSTERYPRSVLKFHSDTQKSKLHPTQKPLALIEYFIKTYSNKGDVVIDLTMGSGTTGEGCKRLCRDFVGVELDKNYYDIAVKRIKEA